MSTAVRTYDPDKVNFVMGGIPLSGYADGTFINIEELGEGTSSESGADGEVARAMSTDFRTRVTITLQQTSQANNALSALLDVDRRSGGAGIVPAGMADLSGSTLFAAPQAWVTKRPAVSFSKGIETREWVIETGRPSVWLIGGNA